VQQEVAEVQAIHPTGHQARLDRAVAGAVVLQIAGFRVLTQIQLDIKSQPGSGSIGYPGGFGFYSSSYNPSGGGGGNACGGYSCGGRNQVGTMTLAQSTPNGKATGYTASTEHYRCDGGDGINVPLSGFNSAWYFGAGGGGCGSYNGGSGYAFAGNGGKGGGGGGSKKNETGGNGSGDTNLINSGGNATSTQAGSGAALSGSGGGGSWGTPGAGGSGCVIFAISA
jgi:hypothetical protein